MEKYTKLECQLVWIGTVSVGLKDMTALHIRNCGTLILKVRVNLQRSGSLLSRDRKVDFLKINQWLAPVLLFRFLPKPAKGEMLSYCPGYRLRCISDTSASLMLKAKASHTLIWQNWNSRRIGCAVLCGFRQSPWNPKLHLALISHLISLLLVLSSTDLRCTKAAK